MCHGEGTAGGTRRVSRVPFSSTWAGSGILKSADPGPSTHFLASLGSIASSDTSLRKAGGLIDRLARHSVCLLSSKIATKRKKNLPEYSYWGPWSAARSRRRCFCASNYTRKHQSELSLLFPPAWRQLQPIRAATCAGFLKSMFVTWRNVCFLKIRTCPISRRGMATAHRKCVV